MIASKIIVFRFIMLNQIQNTDKLFEQKKPLIFKLKIKHIDYKALLYKTRKNDKEFILSLSKENYYSFKVITSYQYD